MTNTWYKEIMDALKAQRKEGTSSREAATKMIDELGIRQLLSDAANAGIIKIKKRRIDHS